ncbi:MAG: universal stress protein [Dehalococcoidia bacterium]
MKIVVAYDGTDGAKQAAQASIPVARASSATLVLLHVLNPRADLADIHGSHQEALREAIRRAEEAAREFIAGQYDQVEVRVETVQRNEDIAETIGRFATAEGADLVVTATRRAGGLSGFFLGSVTQQLIRQSPCPVMVVRVE